MNDFVLIGKEIGEIVAQKNEAYGSSFAKAGEFLRPLYPHGLAVEEFDTALLLVRIFDKLMRAATDADAFGESPFADIAGYGILGVHMHHQRKEHEAWQGSVSGPTVQPSPVGTTPGSAAPNTSAKTTTSANASSGSATSPTPSTPPASSCEEPEPAPVPTATEAVSVSGKGLVQDLGAWKSRNLRDRCAICATSLDMSAWSSVEGGTNILTCSMLCANLLQGLSS